jgi:hypothetical protein
MHPSSRNVWSLGIGAAMCVCASAAASQSPRVIHGTVFDSRDLPVALVNVTVNGGPSAVSDDSGRFRLEISHRNRVVFDLKRLGYTPSRFSLDAGGDTAVSVLLLPTAQLLAGVDVKETVRIAPTIAGFEDRMRQRQRAAGAGYFITVKDIEAMNATRVTQIVQNTPTMSVRRIDIDKYGLYGRAVGTGGDCLATVWVDGVLAAGAARALVDRRGRRVVTGPDVQDIDSYLYPTEIAGVEIYPRGMMAPPQFLPPGDPNASRCAVVAYWTKHAR